MQIKDLGCKAGVVLNPGTPLSAIEYVLDGRRAALVVLVMDDHLQHVYTVVLS